MDDTVWLGMSEHGAQRSRRGFLFQTAMSTGGVLCLGAHLASAAAADKEQEAPTECGELREQLLIDFQTRQMQERVALFERLVARYGDGIVAEVEANTIATTRQRLQEAPLEHRDLAGVKAYLWDHLGKGFLFTCPVDTSTKLQYRVSHCFIAEEMRRLGAPALGRAFYCAYDLGFCEGLNPQIRFSRTQTLMDGDPCCNHTYELAAE